MSGGGQVDDPCAARYGRLRGCEYVGKQEVGEQEESDVVCAEMHLYALYCGFVVGDIEGGVIDYDVQL